MPDFKEQYEEVKYAKLFESYVNKILEATDLLAKLLTLTESEDYDVTGQQLQDLIKQIQQLNLFIDEFKYKRKAIDRTILENALVRLKRKIEEDINPILKGYGWFRETQPNSSGMHMYIQKPYFQIEAEIKDLINKIASLNKHKVYNPPIALPDIAHAKGGSF